MASTGLMAPAALGFRVRRWGQPSVSASVCRGAVLGGSSHQLNLSQSHTQPLWSDRSRETPCTRMFRDSNSSLTTLSGLPLPRFFTRSRTQRSSESVKVWKLTPSFASRDRSARNPSAVDGTTINFSPFNWTVRPPRQDDCNQCSNS